MINYQDLWNTVKKETWFRGNFFGMKNWVATSKLAHNWLIVNSHPNDLIVDVIVIVLIPTIICSYTIADIINHLHCVHSHGPT